MAIDSVSSAADTLHARATRKAMVRLLPIMLAAYFMAYIDRTNVALAKTQLQADVGISVTAFGLGAGIFFVSYAFLEVPGSLIMHRVGPRRWIARIALTWGALSAAMMFVQGEWSFYVLRFFLGMAEAGLYPTLMYMVTVWFSQKHRATVVGFIYLAPTVALIVGNPMGGALMEFDTALGLHGWQWMFLIEGLVTMLVGVLVWFSLPETPRDASWLTPEEAEILSARAAGDGAETGNRIKGNLKQAFARPFIVIVALIYLFNQVTNVGIVFNMPSIVEELNIHGSFLIGLVSGSSGIGATVGVLLVPVVHRRFGNEVALIGILAASTAVTAAIFLLSSSPTAQILLIAVSMVFVFGTLPLFWSVAMARMSGLVAAAGLAFINTIGLLGGFLGPYAFGLAEDATGNPSAGLYVVIASSVVGVLLTPLLARAVRGEDATGAEAPGPVSR
ncbi:MFS transporter [Streptomyces viridosporus]|uniref:MFS transporter n=1 Tax=Streptomyces viridosporus TaxID=67581 RepID=UPI00370197B9